MVESSISSRIIQLQGLVAPIFRYLTYSAYPRKSGQPGVADFVFGNPQDMPLPEGVAALGGSPEQRLVRLQTQRAPGPKGSGGVLAAEPEPAI